MLPIGLPWLGAHFRIDALSAFFLLVVNGAGVLISLYAIEYTAHDAEPGRVLPFYPLFLAAMNLVLVADDAFVFLVSWEVMSLTSWLLVLSTHRQPETPPAAFLYLVMASLPSACSRVAPDPMPLQRCAEPRSTRPARRCYSVSWWSGPAPRRGWCRSMSGCRPRIPRRPVTCPR